MPQTCGELWLNILADELDPPAPEYADWREWLTDVFPQVCTAPFAKRHSELWKWIEALGKERPAARVEVWPRGGGKSTTGELACVRLSTTLKRRFGLVISSTQDKADTHIQTIGGWMETAGMERAVGKYGTSKGWNRQQLRTKNGFNMAAFGLDAGLRGIKVEQYRPDFLWFDDLDELHDSLKTIEKKVEIIKKSVLPVGSPDVAVLMTQNLIHEESIFSQLVDGRADFLLNRELATVEPAVENLTVQSIDRGDGRHVWRITGGEPTWDGQNLQTCEEQINEWGYKAFCQEAQHEVTNADGYVFDVSKLNVIAPADVPALKDVCLSGDLAATEDGGNWTALPLQGVDSTGRLYILAMIRGQWASDRVRAAIRLSLLHYKRLYPNLRLRLPQDPGQAGKDQARQFRTEYGVFAPTLLPVTGDKATRARGLAEAVNLGNVYLVQQDLPAFLATNKTEEVAFKPLLSDLTWQTWHKYLRNELRTFREDETQQADDQVDACADGHNTLIGIKPPGKAKRSTRGGYV